VDNNNVRVNTFAGNPLAATDSDFHLTVTC
jgi:hypothetical protein